MRVRHTLILSLLASLIVILGACGTGQEESTNASSSATATLPLTEHPDTTGWDLLFQPDFSDAILDTANSWTMEEGVLVANDHSTIWSDTTYGDFVLDFEVRTPDGTNSGVFFRTADRADILSALELQMYNPPGPDAEADSAHRYGGKNGLAALYDLKGPTGGTPKPAGEWNRFTVTARDSMIYVVMNGEQVHEVNLNNWTEPGLTPEGEEHKFDRALMNQAESGPIGIQGIHSENEVSVEYRNLRIRRLEE
ncbi:hypothetical protein BSZ35_14680 [Salinibacter sp. 10B]|uniref:3-keto-disaccharide hydrolase n=1 Tax=Salinibacter sp. 10B TaxID=1923971 RepID=UPI000D2788C1|nr:DUF1080 domain-containing protein [Salinibacter sp. 10B]PQJ35674.1 hypothetical protein BSZ35_14680 [Salinibacter sp. 10B]